MYCNKESNTKFDKPQNLIATLKSKMTGFEQKRRAQSCENHRKGNEFAKRVSKSIDLGWLN